MKLRIIWIIHAIDWICNVIFILWLLKIMLYDFWTEPLQYNKVAVKLFYIALFLATMWVVFIPSEETLKVLFWV